MAGQGNARGPRAYRMGRRREQLEAMRQRIAAAAFELHSTVGPAQTSISAVAERAGVQRHTVYHHFPDLTSLFRACTEHGMRITGVPDAASWRAIKDPVARLRLALGELYAYYRANARLLGNIVRDRPLTADIGGSEAFVERMTELFSALAAGWPDDAPTQRLRIVAIGHAMEYETWRSLTDKGLSDAEAGDLMLRLVSAVESAPEPSGPARSADRDGSVSRDMARTVALRPSSTGPTIGHDEGARPAGYHRGYLW